jgi:hypothetical protein
MNIADLTESLAIEVPGCPSSTIRDMLRWAQRELCNEGNAWLVSDGPVVVGANTPFAEVDVPSGAETLRITKLFQNGRELKPGLDYLQTGSGGVKFLRSLPESVTLLGEIVCRPAYGKDMPAELLSRWAEALMDGARSRLMLLPQPWQDKSLAEHYRRKFLDAQSHARSLAASGYQSGSIRMKTRNTI